MGLLNLLPKSIFGLKGKTPAILDQSKSTSKLHYTYSTTGQPVIPGEPLPSRLDLPTPPDQYILNLPK